MAGALTRDPPGGAIRDTAVALIGMRRSLQANTPGGSGTVLALRGIGLALAVATMLLGLVRFDDPARMVDLLAALVLGWLLGWVMGPILVRGAGQGLRSEWFALVPVPAGRLAAGLLAASFVGAAPAITLVAFAALPVAAARFGMLALLMAVPAALLQVVMAVVLARVVVAALAATLSSRHGQELGGLLMAVVIALASGGWSLATVLGQQLATGPGPALSTALRVLPSGWGPVAVAAAGRSDWPLAIGALAGLAGLSALGVLAWARLLPRTMVRPGGRAPRTARRVPAPPRAAAEHPAARRRLQPAGPTGAVVDKELRAWRRDPGRSLLLLLALLISGLNLVVPALAFHAPAVLPWAGLAAVLIVGSGLANVYGEDGTALWLTRMVPGVERADVRGRQLACLLVLAPLAVGLSVLLTALGGQGWAWPYLLAALPALLGGVPGLMVLMSVTWPVPEKDPHRRASPFDTSDDPATAGTLAGRGYLMLALVALLAVPGTVLVLLGDLANRPAPQAAGVVVGTATGLLLYWWGGRVAARRLADRGGELMDLLRLGPRAASGQEPVPAEEADGRPPRRANAARAWLLTAGIICVVPQGLVPIGFNLFGVDQQVKVWFAARYLSPGLQVPVAAGFVAVGLAAIWWAIGTPGRRAAPRGRGGARPGSNPAGRPGSPRRPG